MVEHRPLLNWVTHGVLLIGVAVVAFPVYVTFVASTHTAAEIVQAPMPMLPGSHFVHNYMAALTGSEKGQGSGAPVARMMWVSLMSALIIAIGIIAFWFCVRNGARESIALKRLSSFWIVLVACQIALGAWTIWSNKAADIATAHVAVGATTFGVGIALATICLRLASEKAPADSGRRSFIAEAQMSL